MSADGDQLILLSVTGEIWLIAGGALVIVGGLLLLIGRRLGSGNVLKLFLSFCGIAAPLVGVSLLPLAVILASGFSDRIKQALITGTIIAAGWFATFLIQEYRRSEDRFERLRDVHRALYAEIGAYLANIVRDPEQLDAERADIVQQIEADHTFVPFVPQENADRVYRAILSDIHILPRSSIDLVVAFYGQLAAISALVENMSTDRYALLSRERRLRMYQDYIGLREGALFYGNAALRVIAAYGKGGARAATRERAEIGHEPRTP